MLLDLVTGFHSSNPIRNLAEITHLIAMKRIAERTRKLTKFIQDKGFEFQSGSRFLYDRLHVCQCIFSVKNHTCQLLGVEGFYHKAVYFSCFTA